LSFLSKAFQLQYEEAAFVIVSLQSPRRSIGDPLSAEWGRKKIKNQKNSESFFDSQTL